MHHLYIIVGKLGPLDTSLFHPTNRGRRQAQPDFVPTFFDQLNITDDVSMTCERNPSCIFDLIATGDMGLALNTLNHEKQTNATRDVLGKVHNKITRIMDISQFPIKHSLIGLPYLNIEAVGLSKCS